jgi:hypothetical protein
MEKKRIQTLLDELEAAGIVVRSGEMRPDRKGVPQPVYVPADRYMNDPEAAQKAIDAMDDPIASAHVLDVIAPGLIPAKGDQNLYVLEVRNGLILYLNERTSAKDGWHWGTDNAFVEGPFPSYELAVAAAQRHCDQERKLMIMTSENIFDPDDYPTSGCLIVVNTDGYVWARETEVLGGGGRRR